MNYTDIPGLMKQAWALFSNKPKVPNTNRYNDAAARRIRHVIAQQLALNDNEVNDSQTWDDLNADDLDRIESLMSLEELFNRQYSDKEYEKAHTIGDLVSLFRSNTYLKPKPIKLNKAQEAIMSNANGYSNSNALLTALEDAEDDSDLLQDMKRGAAKLGYTAYIRQPKRASYINVQRLRKQAARYPIFEPETEATSAAVILAAGTLGGMTFNAIRPTRDKGKSLIKRLMTGAGKGALAGIGAAVGSSLGRNGVAYAINEGWI